MLVDVLVAMGVGVCVEVLVGGMEVAVTTSTIGVGVERLQGQSRPRIFELHPDHVRYVDLVRLTRRSRGWPAAAEVIEREAASTVSVVEHQLVVAPDDLLGGRVREVGIREVLRLPFAARIVLL